MNVGKRFAKAHPRKWAVSCGLVILFLCSGFGVVFLQVFDFPIVASRAGQIERVYRNEGLPWTQEDIQRKVAPTDNADPEFLSRLGSGKPLVVNGKDSYMEVEGALAIGDYAGAGRILDGLAPEIKLFEKASQAKAISFDKDWDQGSFVLFPEFAQIKTGVKLLTYRAEVRAHTGDLDGALLDLRRAYRIGNLVGQEPTLIGALVGIACQAISVRGCERVAALKPNDAAWIAGVRREVSAWKTEIGLGSMLTGEPYMGIATIRNLQDKDLFLRGDMFESGDFSPVANPMRSGFGSGPIRTAYQVRWMEYCVEMKRALDRNPDNAWSATMEAHRVGDRMIKKGHMSDAILEIMLGVYTQAGYAVEKNNRLPQLSEAVLAAAEHKAKTGKWPTTWAEIGMDPVLDPVTGKPALIKSNSERIVIYFVGPDGVDAGGIEDKNGFKAGDDFTVLFPPKPYSKKPSN